MNAVERRKEYIQAILLLQEIKLVNGAEFLNFTLRRHHKLRQFLLDYQKTAIIDLESNI